MAVLEWLQTNYKTLGEVIFLVVTAFTVAVGLADGPRAGRAVTVGEKLLAFMRRFGLGTYKDEPGSLSAPFKGDSKKRVVAVDEA